MPGSNTSSGSCARRTTRPSRLRASAMVCCVTARGATISPHESLSMRFLIHSNCMTVLPSPQSAKIAARPLLIAHVTISRWNGYRPAQRSPHPRPTASTFRAFDDRNSSYVVCMLVPQFFLGPPAVPSALRALELVLVHPLRRDRNPSMQPHRALNGTGLPAVAHED